MGDEFGKVPDDEATALRIASVCKPEDIDNGNLEGMVYLALREASSKLKRGAEGDGKVCPDCNEPCSSLAGNPAKWPVPQPDTQQPGKIRWHHMGCLAAKDARIAEQAERIAMLEKALNEAEKTEIMLRASIAKKNSYICDLELAIETRDARIADLEATVARAFLRCQELEEALGEIYRLTEYLCHADPVPGGETSSAQGQEQSK